MRWFVLVQGEARRSFYNSKEALADVKKFNVPEGHYQIVSEFTMRRMGYSDAQLRELMSHI